MRGSITWTLVLALGVAAPAIAQERPWTGHIMGGTSIPVGGTDDYLGGAFSWGFGAMYSPKEAVWGIRLDVIHSRFNIDNQAVIDFFDGTDGHARTWDLALDGEVGTTKSKPLRVYALAGGGAVNRYAAVTEPAIVSGCYWDPWWGYICGSAPGEQIKADRSTWNFGVKFGGGLSYQIRRGPALFVEAAYNIVFSSSGDNRPADAPEPINTTWVPIFFGFRF